MVMVDGEEGVDGGAGGWIGLSLSYHYHLWHLIKVIVIHCLSNTSPTKPEPFRLCEAISPGFAKLIKLSPD